VNKDKLEKYIDHNREEFNDLVPDSKIWDKINLDLDREDHKKSRFSPQKMLWRVAAVVIIFIASYFFHDLMSKRGDLSGRQDLVEMTDKDNEILKMLDEAEAYYQTQITCMQDEISRFAADNPEIREELNLELLQLDSIYSELKKDLSDNAANEEVVEAMVQNYRIKLDILEDILNQLRKNDKQTNIETHEI